MSTKLNQVKKEKRPDQHPIDKIEWVDVNDLTANGWNPNVCVGLEFNLLKLSLLKQGWIQPILASRDNVIIDGFHRWTGVKGDKDLYAMTNGKVPVAYMDINPAERKLLTVRINRAKGTHVAFKMHELVSQLVEEHGLTALEVAQEIGGTVEEVNTLLIKNVFEIKNVKNTEYSKSWEPRAKAK